MPYPSANRIVQNRLADRLNVGLTGNDRIRVERQLPTNSQYTNRLIVVTVSPSSPGDTTLTVDVADLDVDAYAGTLDGAEDLAELARYELRLGLPGYTDPDSGAFVMAVQTLARPAWAPWDDAARIERFTASYRITLHAAP